MTMMRRVIRATGLMLPLLVLAACGPKAATEAVPDTAAVAASAAAESKEQVLLGRYLVLSHDCGGCHGGGTDATAKGWLAGVMSPLQEFKIGPFTTRPRNLTPDNETGLGRFTERQIFNALRFGLRPESTPDVEITSTIPGQGNYPATPHYLAVPMPWPSWRHMPDKELWAIAAYLHRGLAPVVNKVKDSEGPPDFWASEYTVDKIGAYPAVAFPTANEKGQ